MQRAKENQKPKLDLDMRLHNLQVACSRTASALGVISSPLEGDADVLLTASPSMLTSIREALYGHVQIIDALAQELELAVQSSEDEGA